MVWMLCESFKTHDRSELCYNFTHLAQLSIRGHDLHEFLVDWKHILENMGENAVDERMLRDVFFGKIQHEKCLYYDVNRYERMDVTDPNKTYAFLMTCVKSEIQVQE